MTKTTKNTLKWTKPMETQRAQQQAKNASKLMPTIKRMTNS